MQTIGAFFESQARHWAEHAFLCVPADEARSYLQRGYEITYGEALAEVERLKSALTAAGYGHGHRIAILLENRPEMVLLKLACNALGISSVPVNPDYRPSETAYLLQDSAADLAVCCDTRLEQMRDGVAASGLDVPVARIEDDLPKASRAAPCVGEVAPDSEASLLYTSGTTGRPKGCILSHEYELSLGQWYAGLGGALALEQGKDRVYNPLPLFHVNAGILQLFGMIATGCCQIIPDRFSASRWWRELEETGATACHYLGIIIPALMNQPEGPDDRKPAIKWGAGAGVEPTLHRAFEERFGFPLVEVWGMTEMCRVLADNHAPRSIDTRAMGRPRPGLDVKVVDELDNEVPRGTPGEMVVRHSAETPRKGAFSGYLNLPDATEEAWRGGWFHTGDTVVMDESDMLYFVDRKKNIIRRSGENIAAAEIEACLQEHEDVARVAVIAVEDALRDEEVMACVVPNGDGDEAMARRLFDHAYEHMAYYKAPGWVRFFDEIPVTGTQKIQKHALFEEGESPVDGAYDLRNLKKRS